MSSELCKGQNQQEESPNHSLSERLPALGIKISPFHSFPSFFIHLPTFLYLFYFPLVSTFLQFWFLKNAELLIYLKISWGGGINVWWARPRRETVLLFLNQWLSSLYANICITYHPLLLPLLLFCSLRLVVGQQTFLKPLSMPHPDVLMSRSLFFVYTILSPVLLHTVLTLPSPLCLLSPSSYDCCALDTFVCVACFIAGGRLPQVLDTTLNIFLVP